MHKRKEIKAAVAPMAEAAFAAAGITDGAARVLVQRALPVNHSRYPVCCIYAFPESVQVENTELLRRDLDLHFEFIADGTESEVDDTLDRLSRALEAEVLKCEDLGGLASLVTLSEVAQDYATQARKLVGAIRLTFNVIYFSPRYLPDPEEELKNVSVNPGSLTEDFVALPD